jgi:hypothetical protein
MNEHVGPDPLDELRAADPVHPDRLSSASLARIRARVGQEVMTSAAPTPSRRTRSLGLGAGVVALSALALVLAFGGRGAAPGLPPGGSVDPGSAACVEPYSPTAIARRAFAFEGTVITVDGDRVTFAVGTAWRGASSSTITLEAPGMTGSPITSAGGPNLTVGERYLVAGDDTFVWSCGYTQAYDPAIAEEWAAAFGG